MRDSEKTKFYALVADVLAYYRQDASKFTLSVWWEGLKRFELEQINTALTAHATNSEKEGDFCPKVSNVIRMLEGTKSDKSAMAWSKVHGAMSSVGAYTDVIFDDAAIHAAIEDMGGWPKLCRGEISELSYTSHRFCESYKSYVGRIDGFKYPRKLPGDRDPDSVYEKFGRKPPRPALIGNPARAKDVYLMGEQGGKTQVTFARIDAANVIDVIQKQVLSLT